MSCNMTIFAEKRVEKSCQWEKIGKHFTSEDGEKTDKPFDWQYYGLYGFLAGVRNYSKTEVIKMPMGLPLTLSEEVKLEWESEKWISHTPSYLKLSDLLAFDYDKKFVDQRDGNPEQITYREFLGDLFFTNFEELKAIGDPNDVRVIFWFDN